MVHKELEPHPVCQQSITGIGKPLARATGRVPREACYFTDGRQVGQHNQLSDLNREKDHVPTNQHSLNGGYWALGARFIKEITNDKVCVFGENQHKTTNQALYSFGSVVSTVATHLAIVGRGFVSVPSVVITMLLHPNPSFKADCFAAA